MGADRSSEMNKRIVIGGITFIVLFLAGGWFFGLFGGADPALAELEQMRDQMFENRDLPDAERRQQWDNFRQRIDGLSDDQRRAFFEASRGQWMQRAEQRMDDFFAMPANEQNKQLDEMIQRMLKRRNERAQSAG